MLDVPIQKRKAKLLDGNEIPLNGLGTYLSAPSEVTNAVVAGWKCGIRHFDCAQFYRNETEVGHALRILAKEPGFKREEIFITSKAWNSHHRPENVKKALAQTLKDLGTDYLDLYLVHWPVSFAAVEDASSADGIKLEPHDGKGKMLLDKEISLSETWKAFIEAQAQGKVKSIGVSNFRPSHIQKLIDDTGVTPAVNQVEAHPYLNQQELLDYCTPRGIHITAYMPFGGDASRGGVKVLGNPLVADIAKKDDKDAGQVLASWGIKRGFSVLPKSVKPSRIESNFQVYDLDDQSYDALLNLGRRQPTRFGGIPYTFDPAWEVNVFNTPDEAAANLFEPF
ncbi:hypothetical protein A1O3_10461 [Capronia epimyces CBS 606.96]|uniref:D-xylose reductase [NAD(P)H] n=1 Tax=Capronia epimyces CBS 606.96 TaxID=1182542 RepID=W9XAN3_9EURO|nr:uncharacterized protein A1O3_10461 [Capronia epimyces CBS 606.96]EXJ77303.1 hypothetical protein A1O3_10461 [Capronia epimyces CBS 606.96]